MTGYAFTLWTCVITSNITISVFAVPRRLPQWMMYYPNFPFVRAMYLLLDPCTWEACLGDMDMAPPEFYEMIGYLLMNSVLYLIGALYLNEVWPQEFGVQKHPLFMVEGLIKQFIPSIHNQIFNDESTLIGFRDEDELKDEDDDVRQERKTVQSLDKRDYKHYPLVVKDVRKVYPGIGNGKPKIANYNINLKIEEGELFGLLGPNGAGKTTLITQLTGLYPPTDGNAWIGGFDVRNQLDIVQLQIGVCPQFDILWSDLTVEEHLLFYARVKGICQEEEEAKVTQALKEVQLLEERSILTSELPLGMKRRLSIAISLVSSPKIIFLDEPTTGLDPDTRR